MIDLLKESILLGGIGSIGATSFIFVFNVLRRVL